MQDATIPLSSSEPLVTERAWSTPWYWGWNVFAVCIVVAALTYGLLAASFGLLAEHWKAEFKVDRSLVMLSFMVGTIAMGLASPFAGRFMDTGSARRVMSVGLLAFAGGLVALAFATRPWHLIVCYGIAMPAGVIVAGLIPAQVLTARWFADRRGFALGFAASATSLGGVVMPPIVAVLISAFGWRLSLGVIAFVTIAVLLPLVLLFVRDCPQIETQTKLELPVAARTYSTAQIVSERNFWILTFVYLAMFLVDGGFAANMVAYCASHGLTVAQSAVLLSAFFFTMILAKLGWGFLADRVSRRLLVIVAVFGNIAGFTALGLAQGFWPVCLAVLCLSICAAGALPLVSAILSYQFGNSFGRAFGLLGLGLPLSAAGAPLIAKLQEYFGNYTAVMLLLAVFVALAGLSAFFLQTKSARPEELPICN